MALNPSQIDASTHTVGPCLCTASPGSGKTKCLEERTANLIASGVNPRSILSITFTNKAAKQLKERIQKRVGDDANKIPVYTFHGFCARLLRKNGHVIGYNQNMTILDEHDQIDLLSQVVRSLGYEYTKPTIKACLKEIGDARENLENDDQMYTRMMNNGDPDWFGIGQEYIKRLREQNSIDFSGLLSETARLLENKDVLDKLQNWVKYLQIDETQDTNYVQYVIANKIISHTKNIFCVGDLNQSIYAFRGSRIENISDFLKTYPDAKIIKLGQNYRSTPQILSVCDKLIHHNTNRIDVDLTTDNPDGSNVILKKFNTDREEAAWVVASCKRLINDSKIKPKEIAVLYRLNSISRAIEMEMVANKIPYKIIGGFSFYDRREIRDILYALRFLTNPKDGIAFHRICNKPKRGLGDSFVAKLENVAKINGSDLIQACKDIIATKVAKDGLSEIIMAFDCDYSNLSIPEVMNTLIQRLRYDDYLKDEMDTYNERKENIDELINSAALYNAEHGSNIGEYLESLALVSQIDDDKDEDDKVKLLTIHSAKGLEFDVVFLVSVQQDILPHIRAIQERPNGDGLEEETRIAYVAMSRPRKILSVSYCSKRQDIFGAKSGIVRYKDAIPSQFLYESGLLKDNFDKYKGKFASR